MSKVYFSAQVFPGVSDGGVTWTDFTNSSVPEQFFAQGSQAGFVIRNFETYNHSRRLLGGDWEMSATFRVPKGSISYWEESGLGSKIYVKDAAGRLAWGGYINEIEFERGGEAIRIGPLLQATAQGRLDYSTTDTSTVPPTMGIRKSTDLYQNNAVLDKYGKLHGFFSSGGATEANAVNLLVTQLVEQSYPPMSRQYTDKNSFVVKITAIGAVRLMSKAYIDTKTWGAAAVQTADEWIRDLVSLTILHFNSMGFLPFLINNNPALANGLQLSLRTSSAQASGKSALDLLDDICAFGDGTSRAKYTFQFQSPDYCAYYKINSRVEMIIKSGIYGAEFLDMRTSAYAGTPPFHGRNVPYWHLRAGYRGMMIGNTDSAPFYRHGGDGRTFIISEVQYTAPYTVRVATSPYETLSLLLASLGLSGIGGSG